jgi:hypothetical protein
MPFPVLLLAADGAALLFANAAASAAGFGAAALAGEGGAYAADRAGGRLAPDARPWRRACRGEAVAREYIVWHADGAATSSSR